ncbi:hypothetical protein V502_01891 [Pseudogymnoascus sp. VKM F-4520 (FW-2644)]|nr:hypothetical protein V502_01891 [Pseudogymnoascus sp. VKM F-4520 (FW-2644)]
MASDKKTVIAFDLYGTLLSTDSIAKELSSHFGDEKAKTIAALWRRYQLEYTWRLNSMSIYKDFSTVTRASLTHALAEASLSLDPAAIDSLMRAYDSLDLNADAGPGLMSLQSSTAIDAYIFSNGSPAMLKASVTKSLSLAQFQGIFRDIVSVEDVNVYKPDPRAYHHLAGRVGRGDLESIWLVSSNPFDIVGARAAGLKAAWVDRQGLGWIDGLGELVGGKGPTIVVRGVDEAVKEIQRQAGDL